MSRVIVVDPTDSLLVERIAEEAWAVFNRRMAREVSDLDRDLWTDVSPGFRAGQRRRALDFIEAINAVLEPEDKPSFSRTGECLTCGCPNEGECNDDDY